MSSTNGRHRRRSSPSLLLPVAVVVLLGAGFAAGIAADRVLDDDRPGASAPAQTTAPPSAGSPTTTEAAPADPSNVATGDAARYLEALEAAAVPVGANRDVALAVGRGVCQAPPERRAEPAVIAEDISAVFAAVWSAEEASRMVQAAEATLC